MKTRYKANEQISYFNILIMILIIKHFCVQKNPLYCPERCCAFHCDLTKDDLRENVPEGSVDVVTLIFVLSAVHPDKMKLALQNINRVRAETCLERNVFVICGSFPLLQIIDHKINSGRSHCDDTNWFWTAVFWTLY